MTAGLFELVNRLYGIRVTGKPGVPVWDPEVRYYEIRDQNDAFLGAFYTDGYPRENKRGGAWADWISPAARPRTGSSLTSD